jgi:hypothetical protein
MRTRVAVFRNAFDASEVRSVAPGPAVFAGKGLVSRCAPIEEEIFAIDLGICPVAGLRYH